VIDGEPTQVLVEQTTAIAPERLGEHVGHLRRTEVEEVNAALRLALQLD
jgi:mRNA interferase MazF